jgi:hypothetical protein
MVTTMASPGFLRGVRRGIGDVWQSDTGLWWRVVRATETRSTSERVSALTGWFLWRLQGARHRPERRTP